MVHSMLNSIINAIKKENCSLLLMAELQERLSLILRVFQKKEITFYLVTKHMENI